ncbi:hypothetical protein BC830DRAFT_1144706 [Chytriomyces sp. MP71]|nr:hypothetical protein BC830DRAFT_1144706 [Chytriomyces sp. MP71]
MAMLQQTDRVRIPPPSFLSPDTKNEMTTSLLIQKELSGLSEGKDPSAYNDESDPIDESLTLFELFLLKIQTRRYAEALQVASEILKTDPNNPLITEYVPVLKEKLLLDLYEATEREDMSESGDDADSDDSAEGSDTDSEVDSDAGGDLDSDLEDESEDDGIDAVSSESDE